MLDPRGVRVTEHHDDEIRPIPEVTPTPPQSEGVRIIGAQEAAAMESAAAAPDSDDAAATPVAGLSELTPGAANPWVSTEGPSWSATTSTPDTGSSGDATEAIPAIIAEPVGEAPELQPWTDAPTGQIPAVFVADAEPDDAGVAHPSPSDDTDDVWASLSSSQPRFRAEGDDWSDADFREALAGDDDIVAIGADREPVLDVTEDDAAFVAAVRARRRVGTRAVVTSTPEPRSAEGASRRPGRRPAAAGAEGADTTASSGRDIQAAVLTGVVFGVVALICFAVGATTSALLAAAVIGVCAFELCTALQSKGLRPATIPVIASCALMPLVMLHSADVVDRPTAAAGLAPMAVMFLLVTVVSMLWYLFKAGPGRAVIGVATSMFAFAYIGGLGGYAGLLLQRGSSHGVRLLLATILCVVAYDVVGYFVGSRFGVNTIAPDVSPHKTVEGTLAGVGASILVSMIIVARMLDWSGAPHHGLLQFGCVGFVLGVAALLGDLCESMFKRDLGIKDLGSVLPGHGGFLDRFDGLLFALPVMFFLSLGLNLF